MNLAEDTTFSVNDPEILDELPEGLRGSNTIAELYLNMTNQDIQGSVFSPAGIGFNSQVNEEFIETVLVCSLERQNVKGHCLGRALMGAMSRRVDGERKLRSVSQATGCPGIIDTGASKTVIGQRKNQGACRKHAT